MKVLSNSYLYLLVWDPSLIGLRGEALRSDITLSCLFGMSREIYKQCCVLSKGQSFAHSLSLGHGRGL
jgi:hypothetical protein